MSNKQFPDEWLQGINDDLFHQPTVGLVEGHSGQVEAIKKYLSNKKTV